MRNLPAALLFLALTVPTVASALSLNMEAVPTEVELNDVASLDSVIPHSVPIRSEELVKDGTDETTAPPVPEPGTMILLGAGFLGLAIYGKRRKNS